MKNNGVVEVDLGGKLQLKTGIGNIVFNEGKLDITWVDEDKALDCVQFAISQRRFPFTIQLAGALSFATNEARIRGVVYHSESMAITLHLDFM